MKIVRISAKDFMILRDIAVKFKGKGLTQFTGKNGAGKSTLLRFIEWMLAGNTTIKAPQKKSIVRRGATRAWGEIELADPKIGHFVVTRTVTNGGTLNLDIFEWRDGKPFERVKNQDKWLKALFTGLSFDPLAFAQMDTDEQITELKRLAQVDLDFPALAAADAEDREQRRIANREVDNLEAQAGAIPDLVLDGLPEVKVDESAIFQKLAEANQITAVKTEKNDQMRRAQQLHDSTVLKATNLKEQIERLQRELEATESAMVDTLKQLEVAEDEYDAAPSADLAALTQELQKAQRTNRAIDTRARWEKLNQELDEKRRIVVGLDDRIKSREQLRAQAIANATLPVKDLTFDESQVLYKGLPLASQGEGDQIRISTLLGIAMNPDLRCMCIQHGEALDEEGLELIEKLAFKHDFQVVMARVETSGKVGIVIEQGRIVANNESQAVTQ